MRDETGPQSRALDDALTNVTVQTRDKAAVALARRYSTLLDEATPASKYREPLLLISQALPRDPQIEAAFRKIADALGEHSVASDLGPKLLAVLTALGMTPAGRGVKDGAPPDDGKPKGKADELAARREDRERRRGEGGAG